MARAPRKWNRAELSAGRDQARELYREMRLSEPSEIYGDYYVSALLAVDELLEASVDFRDLRQAVEEYLLDESAGRVLRYLTGPPISADDLKVLADVNLTKRFFVDEPRKFGDVADVISQLLDRHRFPWVAEGREPTAAERELATVSTAAIIAHQQVQSARRNQARDLEHRTAALLRSCQFEEVAKRKIEAPGDWPNPGEFCGECKVAGRQADLAVTLWDSRYMPIECKVSGSELNSIKRLDNDALAKFEQWLKSFGGTGNTIPIAIIEGVFSLERLVEAQEVGARLVWGHDLSALSEFVNESP